MPPNLAGIGCGRAGVKMRSMADLLTYISSRGEAAAYRQAAAEALESLPHRGPDETGVEVVGTDVIFAHKRLSIIDVAGSHEPLPYADGRYPLTYNGEIYNYIQLREELIREHGPPFDTQRDADVVVAGDHYSGEAVLHPLPAGVLVALRHNHQNP